MKPINIFKIRKNKFLILNTILLLSIISKCALLGKSITNSQYSFLEKENTNTRELKNNKNISNNYSNTITNLTTGNKARSLSESLHMFFLNEKFTTENEIKNKNSNKNKFNCKNCSASSTAMLNKLSVTVSKFKKFKTDFAEVKMSSKLIQDIRARVNISNIYTYIKENSEIYLTNTELSGNGLTNKKILSKGEFKNSRYSTGWDELRLKTYAGNNPLIQCWSAGFTEGLLTHKEITFYFNNVYVFFHEDKSQAEEIKGLYTKLHSILKKKIDTFDFNLEINSDSFTVKKWAYQACILAQLEGVKAGYNTISDNKLTIGDFYFMNSEGNFGDFQQYLKVNKMKNLGKEFNTKENLKKIYNTDNIKDIWKKLVTKGHCSALVKLLLKTGTKGESKYDILLGHNTWTDYSEMLRTLKVYDFGFEGKKLDQNGKDKDNDEVSEISNLDMHSIKVSFSSYPGVIFSGDDFYLIDSKIGVAQTTLSSVNKFIYKNLIQLDDYVPEFVRIMTTNFMSNTALDWYKHFSSYKNHMYVTQWLVVDYKVLDDINKSLTEGKFNIESVHQNNPNLILLIEDVPTSIKATDITKFLFNKSSFGSFNFPYFPEHRKILGISKIEEQIDLYSKENNPRYYLFNQLDNKITDIDSFAKVIMYNGYNNRNSDVVDDPSLTDPSNGISSREDLTSGTLHGGVDFKVSNK